MPAKYGRHQKYVSLLFCCDFTHHAVNVLFVVEFMHMASKLNIKHSAALYHRSVYTFGFTFQLCHDSNLRRLYAHRMVLHDLAGRASEVASTSPGFSLSYLPCSF